jgi:hypothetical protein
MLECVKVGMFVPKDPEVATRLVDDNRFGTTSLASAVDLKLQSQYPLDIKYWYCTDPICRGS